MAGGVESSMTGHDCLLNDNMCTPVEEKQRRLGAANSATYTSSADPSSVLSTIGNSKHASEGPTTREDNG